MPQPGQEVIIVGPLRDVSIAYRNRLYVADRVFPLIDNVPPEAKIAKYLKGAWFRDEAQMRGPGGEAVRGGYPIGWIDIVLKEYAFAKEVTDEDREIAASQGGAPLQPDRDAVEFAQDRVLLRRETRLATLIKATQWSGVAAGGTDADGKWAAGSGNTFLADIKAKKALMQSATGLIPNVLLMDNGTYNSLTEESTVLDKIKYTQLGVLTNQLLAAILDLDEVLVAGAVTSTVPVLREISGLAVKAAVMVPELIPLEPDWIVSQSAPGRTAAVQSILPEPLLLTVNVVVPAV